jgi:hypothetical protein
VTKQYVHLVPYLAFLGSCLVFDLDWDIWLLAFSAATGSTYYLQELAIGGDIHCSDSYHKHCCYYDGSLTVYYSNSSSCGFSNNFYYHCGCSLDQSSHFDALSQAAAIRYVSCEGDLKDHRYERIQIQSDGWLGTFQSQTCQWLLLSKSI